MYWLMTNRKVAASSWVTLDVGSAGGVSVVVLETSADVLLFRRARPDSTAWRLVTHTLLARKLITQSFIYIEFSLSE